MVAAGVGRVPVRKEKAKIVLAICSCGSNREQREAVRRTCDRVTLNGAS